MQKLLVPQLFKFYTSHRTLMFITIFTRANHHNYPKADEPKSTPISWFCRPILKLHSHLCRYASSSLFHSDILRKFLYALHGLSACYMSCLPYLCSAHHNISQGSWIIKPCIVYFYFPLTSPGPLFSGSLSCAPPLMWKKKDWYTEQ